MILQVFTGAFVDAAALDASVAFRKALRSGAQTLRFAYPETRGAEQLEAIQATPVGRKTRFRHPDGLVVEYVDRRGAIATLQPSPLMSSGRGMEMML
jgi:hypothetical protein